MKKNIKRIAMICVCTVATATIVLNAFAADHPNGQVCKNRPPENSGECNGSPPCNGSKTEIQYEDCLTCREGKEKDDCTVDGISFSCTRKQRSTPCVKSASTGKCIDGTPGAWETDYPDMKDC